MGYTHEATEVTVQADDAKLFCRIFGKGDPIIIIHGGPGLSQDYLLPNMAKLSRTHQAIFYDQRACGQSTDKINECTIQIKTYLSDIESIRKSFGDQQVIVVGHSWGGFLAMEYAIQHPEAVQKLVLLNAMPSSSEEYLLFLQEFMKRMAPCMEEFKAIQESSELAKGDPQAIEKYHLLMFKKYCFDPEKALLLNVCMTPKAFLDGLKVYKIFDENLFSKPFNLHPQLKTLKIPTLIVHGDYDIIPPSIAQKLHETIPNSQYVLINNCGHFPYVEAPEELFNTINEFLHDN